MRILRYTKTKNALRNYEPVLRGGIIDPVFLYGFGYLDKEKHAMVYIGMDLHQPSTTFCLFNPAAPKGRQYRTLRRPTTLEAIKEVLRPHEGGCQVAFEVGTQAQWIARQGCSILGRSDFGSLKSAPPKCV